MLTCALQFFHSGGEGVLHLSAPGATCRVGDASPTRHRAGRHPVFALSPVASLIAIQVRSVEI